MCPSVRYGRSAEMIWPLCCKCVNLVIHHVTPSLTIIPNSLWIFSPTFLVEFILLVQLWQSWNFFKWCFPPFQGRGKAGTQLKSDSLFNELKEQSQVLITTQQFAAALKILQDEDFLFVAGQNVRICWNSISLHEWCNCDVNKKLLQHIKLELCTWHNYDIILLYNVYGCMT